jgi:hypothetical protein
MILPVVKSHYAKTLTSEFISLLKVDREMG